MKLINTPENPLSESAIVDATLAFANGANLQVSGFLPRAGIVGGTGDEHILEWTRMTEVGRLLKESDEFDLSKVLPPTKADLLVGKNEKAIVDSYYANVRNVLKANLWNAIENPAGTARALVELQARFQVRIESIIKPTAAGLSMQHYYAFTTVADLTNLGTVLVLAEGKGFIGKLCRCHLETCGKFFLKRKPRIGVANYRFCYDSDCGKISHNLNSGKRKKDAREAKLKAASQKGTRNRHRSTK